MAYHVAKAKKGKGLFATRAIAEGEIILLITGPKMTYQEVLRMKNPDNALAISKRRYLNLRAPGVYSNHSCDPNAGVNQQLQLVAIKPIKKGEEITWDYSTTLDWTICNFECHCGAKDCRGEITDFIEMPKKKQQYYLKKGVVMPFIAKIASEQ